MRAATTTAAPADGQLATGTNPVAVAAGRGRSPSATRALSAVALVLVAGGLLALLYAASVHSEPGGSDGATIVLEGQSIAAGHLALHGWGLSYDSFWTVDALLYGIAVAVAGVRSALLDLVPAIIALATVVTGALMARDGRKGWAGVAAAVTVVAIIGLPTHVLSIFLLKGPLHIGTALWCLFAFAAMRRSRYGLGLVVGALFLAAGILGDIQALAFGVAPVVVAGLLACWRARDWRRGAPAVIGGVGSVLLAVVVREGAKVVGTFSIAAPEPRATWPQVLPNIAHIVTLGGPVLGVGGSLFGLGGVPAALEWVHIVAVAAVVGAVGAAAVAILRGLFVRRPAGATATDERGEQFLDDVLVLAFFADLVTFVFLAATSSPAYGRYLTAAAIFGAVLAGRVIGRLADGLRPGLVRRVAAAGGIAVVCAFGAATGIAIAQPVQPGGIPALGQFLAAHHLTNGIGDYWSASIVTVTTDDEVAVRPVIVDPKTGRIVRYDRNSTESCYAQPFQFLVYDTVYPYGGVDSSTAVQTFGQPAATYRVGTYLILTYPKSISVATTGWA